MIKTKNFSYTLNNKIMVVTCLKTRVEYTMQLRGLISQPLVDNVVTRLKGALDTLNPKICRRFFLGFMSEQDIVDEITAINAGQFDQPAATIKTQTSKSAPKASKKQIRKPAIKRQTDLQKPVQECVFDDLFELNSS